MKPSSDDIRGLARSLEMSRREKKLSFKELSAFSGVDSGQANRICRGDFATFSGNVVRICIALDVPVPLPHASIKADPVLDARLQAALASAWDRSPEGADQLVRLLNAVGRYRELGSRR